MVLPICVLGLPVLREEAKNVEENSGDLQKLIDDMIETMHGASGIGLAAPQVGRGIRLFVVDVRMAVEDEEEDEPVEMPDMPMVFINPELVWASEETVDFEEGCLSIPDIRERVTRPERIRVRYLDRHFVEHELEAGTILARVIQHEYDHLDGVLFIDHINAFRRRILSRRLREMSRGAVEAEYPILAGGSPGTERKLVL